RPSESRAARLIASTSSDKMLIVQAHHSAWTTFQGEDAEVVKHAEMGWANYDPQSSSSHVFLFGGHDPGACSRTGRALHLTTGILARDARQLLPQLSTGELVRTIRVP